MAIINTLFDFTQPINCAEVPNKEDGTDSLVNRSHSIVYQIPFVQEQNFIATMLGWSYTSVVDSVAYLKRNNPMQHPRFPELRCSNCQLMGYKKVVGTPLQAGYTYNSPNGQPGARSSVVPLAAPNKNQVPFYTPYKIAEIKCDFTCPTMNYHEDIENVAEIDRNVSWSNNSNSTSFITREGSQCKFSTGPQSGTTLPNSFSIAETKTSLTAIWEVPESWVCGASHPLMPKIQAAAGRVNLTTFLGCQPGEILLLDPRDGERQCYPVYSDTGLQVFFRRVELPFVIFKPSYGTGTFYAYGHQTAPNPVDNKYYPFTTDGTNPAAGSSLYKYPWIDFNTIFTQATA